MKLNKEVFKRASTWANISVAAIGPLASQVGNMQLDGKTIMLMLIGNAVVAICQMVKFTEE